MRLCELAPKPKLALLVHREFGRRWGFQVVVRGGGDRGWAAGGGREGGGGGEGGRSAARRSGAFVIAEEPIVASKFGEVGFVALRLIVLRFILRVVGGRRFRDELELAVDDGEVVITLHLVVIFNHFEEDGLLEEAFGDVEVDCVYLRSWG